MQRLAFPEGQSRHPRRSFAYATSGTEWWVSGCVRSFTPPGASRAAGGACTLAWGKAMLGATFAWQFANGRFGGILGRDPNDSNCIVGRKRPFLASESDWGGSRFQG